MQSMKILRPLFAVLTSAFAVTAHAVPVSYTFSGTFLQMGWGLPAPEPFGGQNPLGHTASGSFTFDVDAMNNRSTDPARLFLRPTSSTFANFDLSVDGFAPLASFGSAGGNCDQPYSYFAMSDNNPNAGFPPQPGRVTDEWVLSVQCSEQIAPGVEVTRGMTFEFNDWNPSGSPDLIVGMDPTQLFDWALATTNLISFSYVLTDANCATCMYGMVENWSLGLSLESLTSTATNVPEPATAMLLMLGLTGCWVARRQRVQLAGV